MCKTIKEVKGWLSPFSASPNPLLEPAQVVSNLISGVH